MSNDVNKRGLKPQSDFVDVTEAGVQLPNKKARAIKLSNFNTDYSSRQAYNTTTEPREAPSNNLPADYSQDEVIFGFAGSYAHQLFPGESTEVLEITNLADVCLKARQGKERRIFYTFWN